MRNLFFSFLISSKNYLFLFLMYSSSQPQRACSTHGEDNGSRTGNSVTAGEHAVLGGDAVLVVSHDAALRLVLRPGVV